MTSSGNCTCCRTKQQELSVPQEISNPRDLQRRSNSPIADKSIAGYSDNVASRGLQQRLDEESSSDYGEETGKNTAGDKDDKNKETGEVARLSRDTNAGLDRYTDQEERSSLYDDYEAKDIAKRGILGGPEDYEEESDDSSNANAIEDTMAAVEEQESLDDEGTAATKRRRAARGDGRVKRDQSVSEAPDKFDSSSNDQTGKSRRESRTMENYPQLRPQVSSRISESPQAQSLNEASASTDASKLRGSNEQLSIDPSSGFNDVSKMDEATSVQAPSKRSGESTDAEYEKRVEEEIQRKIDSIKEEIQRDIETQRRINDIEENNARFDELQDQEREEQQEKQNSEMEPIEKRQTVSKRSIRGSDNDGVAPSKSSEKKRSLKGGEQYARAAELRSSRSNEIGKSDGSLKEEPSSRRDEDAKKRREAAVVVSHDDVPGGTPSKRCFKKKRNRVRQAFPVFTDERHRTKRRHSRSYASSSLEQTGVRPENELFNAVRDPNSYLRTDNRMVRPSGGAD